MRKRSVTPWGASSSASKPEHWSSFQQPWPLEGHFPSLRGNLPGGGGDTGSPCPTPDPPGRGRYPADVWEGRAVWRPFLPASGHLPAGTFLPGSASLGQNHGQGWWAGGSSMRWEISPTGVKQPQSLPSHAFILRDGDFPMYICLAPLSSPPPSPKARALPCCIYHY